MGKFKDLLDKNEYVILDGALGTELENRGYDVSGKLWSAKYLLENPKVIQDLHEVYFELVLISSQLQVIRQPFKDLKITV